MTHVAARTSRRTSRIGCGLLLLLLAACQSETGPTGTTDRHGTTRPAGPADWRIIPGIRIGPVDSTTSEQALVERLGAERVVRRDAHIGEGFCAPASVIDPGTRDSVTVIWADTSYARPAAVVVEGNGSRWRTAAWVHVGTTLRELEALRAGAPLRFMGFGWDYGGTGTWHEQGTREMRIVLQPDSASWATASRDPRAREIMGDREVSSNHPLIRRMNVRVERMSIQWTQPTVQYQCPGL